jgi:choline dehydrogenase-like flavoprotein
MASETFDFVVVGGGTSGLVLANRLTENPNVSVLVLEAGNDSLDDPRVAVPGMCSSLQKTELDWDFCSIPQVKAPSQLTRTGLLIAHAGPSERTTDSSSTRQSSWWI